LAGADSVLAGPVGVGLTVAVAVGVSEGAVAVGLGDGVSTATTTAVVALGVTVGSEDDPHARINAPSKSGASVSKGLVNGFKWKLQAPCRTAGLRESLPTTVIRGPADDGRAVGRSKALEKRTA
jgi:hypothetical protein